MNRPAAGAVYRWGFPILLALLLLGLKWPALSLPIWGDGQAYVVPNGLLLLEEPGRLFIPDEVHPPFYFRLLSETYRLFGTGLGVSHGLIILFAWLALLYTWRLGETFFGRGTGVAASLLLLFCPLFFCQSGLVRLAIPLTALAVMTLYYGLSARPLPLALCGTALVLTKHPGVFVTAGLLAALLLPLLRRGSGNTTPGRKFSWPLLLATAVPAGVFLLWALLCRLHYGWMFHPENTADLGLSVGPLLSRVGYWLRQLLLLKWMWVPALFTLAGAVVLLRRGRTGGQTDNRLHGLELAVAMGLPFLLFIGFFSCYAFDFPRYLLPLYPSFFLLAAAGAAQLTSRRPTVGLLLLLALSLPLFTCGWFRNYTLPRPRHYYESDLAYGQVLAAKRAAAAHLEQHHPGKTILTGKPALDLREPAFGYVSRPMKVLHLPRKRGLDLDRFRQADLFYLFSSTSPEVEGENEQRLIRAGIRPVPEADFSIPAIQLKLYRLEPVPPAAGNGEADGPGDKP